MIPIPVHQFIIYWSNNYTHVLRELVWFPVFSIEAASVRTRRTENRVLISRKLPILIYPIFKVCESRLAPNSTWDIKIQRTMKYGWKRTKHWSNPGNVYFRFPSLLWLSLWKFVNLNMLKIFNFYYSRPASLYYMLS